jgi:hypothetical protein
MDGSVEFFAYGREHFPRLVVISRANLRARFLQSALHIRHRRPRGAQFLHGRVCRFGGLESRSQLGGTKVDVRNEDVDRLLGLRLGIAGLADRVLCALTGIDGVAESLAIVALVDGRVRLLHAGHGGGVFLGGVFVGAGGAREVDRGLSLIDFFLGGLRAGGRGHQEESDDESAAHRGRV